MELLILELIAPRWPARRRLLARLGPPAMSGFAPLLGDKRTPSVPIYEYTA